MPSVLSLLLLFPSCKACLKHNHDPGPECVWLRVTGRSPARMAIAAPPNRLIIYYHTRTPSEPGRQKDSQGRRMLELDLDVFNHICVQRACISTLREYLQGASLSLPLVSVFRFRLYPVFCMLPLYVCLCRASLREARQ